MGQDASKTTLSGDRTCSNMFQHVLPVFRRWSTEVKWQCRSCCFPLMSLAALGSSPPAFACFLLQKPTDLVQGHVMRLEGDELEVALGEACGSRFGHNGSLRSSSRKRLEFSCKGQCSWLTFHFRGMCVQPVFCALNSTVADCKRARVLCLRPLGGEAVSCWFVTDTQPSSSFGGNVIFLIQTLDLVQIQVIFLVVDRTSLGSELQKSLKQRET